jgi:hypothetical protein
MLCAIGVLSNFLHWNLVPSAIVLRGGAFQKVNRSQGQSLAEGKAYRRCLRKIGEQEAEQVLPGGRGVRRWLK